MTCPEDTVVKWLVDGFMMAAVFLMYFSVWKFPVPEAKVFDSSIPAVAGLGNAAISPATCID